MDAVLGFLFGWMIGSNNKKIEDSKFIRIDDKNYIIDGKFISYEEDTPLLRFQQEQEDEKHYRNYERYRLKLDRDDLYGNWNKTMQYIIKNKKLLDEVTKEELLVSNDKYIEYCNKVNKHKLIPKLTEVEFAIKEKYPHHCTSWEHINIFNPAASCYTIYNKKTAKYKGGNMMDMIRKEFNDKWY